MNGKAKAKSQNAKGKSLVELFFNKRTFLLLIFDFWLLTFAFPLSWADKVITKDGKIYAGKILIDSDKAVLIGNPPFDPRSTLIQAEDIQTIVYEQYHPPSPAVRRRGLAL